MENTRGPMLMRSCSFRIAFPSVRGAKEGLIILLLLCMPVLMGIDAEYPITEDLVEENLKPRYIGYNETLLVQVPLESFQNHSWLGCDVVFTNIGIERKEVENPSSLHFIFPDGSEYLLSMEELDIAPGELITVTGNMVGPIAPEMRNIFKMGMVMVSTLIELFPEEVRSNGGSAMVNDLLQVKYQSGSICLDLHAWCD